MPSNDRTTIAQLLRGMAMTCREDQRDLFGDAADLIESRRQYLVIIRGLSWDIPVGLFDDLTTATIFANLLDFSGKIEPNLQRVATEMRFCVDAANEYVFNVAIVNFADGKPVDWDVIRDFENEDGTPRAIGKPVIESDLPIVHVTTTGDTPQLVHAAAMPSIDYVAPTSIG